MNWTEQVFAYCERGSNASVFAEPLNALSNIAFFVAAFAGLAAWRARAERRLWDGVLIALLLAIGVGSTLFHTLATRWAGLADSGPIALFMFVYLGIALRRFAGFGYGGSAFGLCLFAASGVASSAIRCPGGACLNGSLAYVSALAALVIVAVLARRRGDAVARTLITGAALFAVSLTARSLDGAVCPYTVIAAHAVGTHALWHILNGLLLMQLVIAAIRHPSRPMRPLAQSLRPV
jgi:hypothetical protein